MENNRKLGDILSDLERGNHLPQSESGFQTIWDAAAKFEYPEQDENAAWVRFKSNLESEPLPTPVKLKQNIYRTWAVAASVALLLAFSSYFLVQKFSTNPIEYVATTHNEIVKLDDGTIITLNRNSKITTDSKFGKSHRNVTLIGEAFFEVNKNTAIPFIVKTGSLQTKVTGTKFDVESYSTGYTHVALTEGSVELILNNKNAASLRPGELAIINHSKNEVQISTFESGKTLSWLESKLMFENTPLSEVINRLEEVLGVKFDYPKELDSVLITTSFTELNPELIAEVLSQTLQTKVSVVKK
ncbi:MAG: FecR domain-containing protein [Bacteroidetes bacterium]|nr:FecR domain-containing protein [Bacteroidota bacterium]